MPSLVFLPCPILHILGQTQTWVFPISGQSLTNKNCHNSKTSNDIDLRLGPATKIERKTRQRQTNFTMTSCQQIVMSRLIFPFIANLEQSESRIPES